MLIQQARFWKGLRPDCLFAVLRIGLGLVFIIGGLKLVFPALSGISDHRALVARFVHPETGWISPFFVQQITEGLGTPIGSFLYMQGWLEILMGSLMILGIMTSMVAAGMGLMFWSFTVASPMVGAIRLSGDLALMGISFAVALGGAGVWSVDGKLWKLPFGFHGRKDSVLVMIRLSIAFTLVTSALFSGGLFDNPLNTTLPMTLVLILGSLLVMGLFPQWVMLAFFLWMLYVIPGALMAQGLFSGLDSIKREIGFLAAALVYFSLGPDRWAWPKSQMLKCRSVVDLILQYLEGSLERDERQAFEAHIADCPKCWKFLKSYQRTASLGQTLREEDVPQDVRKRLEDFLRARLTPK